MFRAIEVRPSLYPPRPIGSLRMLTTSTMYYVVLTACVWTWLSSSVSSSHARTQEEEESDLGTKAIRILKTHCFSCHDEKKSEGGLRLDQRAALLQGGDRGPLLNEVDNSEDSPDDSLLLRCIDGREADLQMPPKNPLRADQIETLRQWLAKGAPWPTRSGESNHENLGNAWEDPRNPIVQKFGGQRLDVWSVRPISRPRVPVVQDPNWARNPIDAFVLARWERDGLVPVAELDLVPLAKRVAFDLTGLPPTAYQLSSFLNDPHEDAYERYVDQLMASPRYGEHMARMWLDVVRYSDSNGFDWDEFRLHAWRYRDYVVRALNQDLPFDRFIVEQLSGDEQFAGAPKNVREQDALIATGYLRLGPHDNAASLFNEQDRSRAELLADLTETTASAFLGMTMSCCRCHDHKTEPISQQDHYRFRAFFAGVKFADDLPLELEAEQKNIDEANRPWEQQIDVVDKQLKEVDKKTRLHQELLEKKQELEKKLLKKSHGLVMTDIADAPPVHVFYQGDHRASREEVRPGFPSILAPNDATIDTPRNPSTSGRRQTLARWIASPDNPWTGRVLVNRLWQSAFGKGIVETSNDFGLSGAQPSDPELLDWLASELIQSEWSIKRVHRTIVTSQTYRQRALSTSSKDVENQLKPTASLRTSMRRLSAEQWRDATLQVSGLIQFPVGGPPVWPELPEDILQANPAFLDDNETKTKGWYPSDASRQSVRSLFLVQKRTVRIPMLETFDLPDNTVSCPRREQSLVPSQALTQLNGALVLSAASALEERTRERFSDIVLRDDPARIVRFLYQEVLLRLPSEQEQAIATQFLKQHKIMEFARVLLNTNEFLFVE